MGEELLYDARVEEAFLELLLLLLHFLHQLSLLLQLQLPVLPDGLVILLTMALHDHPLVLLILPQLLPNLFPLPLLSLLYLTHAFLLDF